MEQEKHCNCSTTNVLMQTAVMAVVGWEDDRVDQMLVLLDSRGYLRLVDLDDYNCLDHGEKVKINFCPFCGRRYE